MTITPDALTSLANTKIMLGLASSNITQDALLNLLISEVSQLITTSCNRTHFLTSNPGAILTDIYSGNNQPWLALNQWPVVTPNLTGNTISGSAAITGLSSTAGLFVNQPVIGAGIPSGALILSIDSASQVTLNMTATATRAAVPLVFYIAMWLNDTANWQAQAGSFVTATQLIVGTDYALKMDLPGGGGSKSGLVFRINGVWNGVFIRDQGMLSAYTSSQWGNIQVQSLVGYPSLPADLELAAIRAIAKIRNSKKYGQMLTSEGLGSYNYQLAESPIKKIALGLLGEDLAPILAKYRITPVAHPSV